MTANIMRKHIQWMPQTDFDKMRELDEQVGEILGWTPSAERTHWYQPGAQSVEEYVLRDDSNELADENEADTGLPFFSYSMNGAMRVLNFLRNMKYGHQTVFWNELRIQASDFGSVEYPECLIALIPELPKKICKALISTHERTNGKEAIERQNAIEQFKDSGANTTSAPWVSATNDTSTVKPASKALKEAIENKKWFGICPLDHPDQVSLALKIDDVEYNLSDEKSHLVYSALDMAARDWDRAQPITMHEDEIPF